MSAEMVGLAIAGTLVAWFAFKLFLGAVSRAVAVPLALGFGASLALLQVHPGLALLVAVATYVAIGKMVRFSGRVAAVFVVFLAGAAALHHYGMIRVPFGS